jgi:hypothetical protein
MWSGPWHELHGFIDPRRLPCEQFQQGGSSYDDEYERNLRERRLEGHAKGQPPGTPNVKKPAVQMPIATTQTDPQKHTRDSRRQSERRTPFQDRAAFLIGEDQQRKRDRAHAD